MPYGYLPFATIKDYDKGQLEKRIADMEKRGYELISRADRNGYFGMVHYAKLKDAKHGVRK